MSKMNVSIWQKLYEETKQRSVQIEEVNKYAGQFMKEAKVGGLGGDIGNMFTGSLILIQSTLNCSLVRSIISGTNMVCGVCNGVVAFLFVR